MQIVRSSEGDSEKYVTKIPRGNKKDAVADFFMKMEDSFVLSEWHVASNIDRPLFQNEILFL